MSTDTYRESLEQLFEALRKREDYVNNVDMDQAIAVFGHHAIIYSYAVCGDVMYALDLAEEYLRADYASLTIEELVDKGGAVVRLQAYDGLSLHSPSISIGIMMMVLMYLRERVKNE